MIIKRMFLRWFVCRDGWWSTPTRPARHDWYGWPELEYPTFICLRCDYQIGPGPI